jgi:phosphoribosyl-dephospho-CoA transferase
MLEFYQRHDLLDVDPAAWAAVLARRRDLDGVPHVGDWALLKRPVIVRRRHANEESALVPVGLPLPPADGKGRISLALPAHSVRLRGPVALSNLIGCPESWSRTLVRVADLASRLGLEPRLFGSLLWQSLTGLRYASDNSDLDILWSVGGALPGDLLEDLATIELRAPMRIDGEILLPDGGGVNWRELLVAKPDDTVLVKHLDRLTLVPASSFLPKELA